MTHETTLFEKIINHEIPAVFIYEDEICISILDKFPNTEGQCLVIPKISVDYVFNLDDDTYVHIMNISKTISKALDATFNTKKTCVIIEGFEVPHAHVKLYPIVAGDLTTSVGEMVEDTELELIAEKIKKNL